MNDETPLPQAPLLPTEPRRPDEVTPRPVIATATTSESAADREQRTASAHPRKEGAPHSTSPRLPHDNADRQHGSAKTDSSTPQAQVTGKFESGTASPAKPANPNQSQPE